MTGLEWLASSSVTQLTKRVAVEHVYCCVPHSELKFLMLQTNFYFKNDSYY